jgi:hypothetical protein
VSGPEVYEESTGAAMLPRWPVYLRFGDHSEVKLGDAYADSPAELLVAMAGLLRSVAADLEDRAARLN